VIQKSSARSTTRWRPGPAQTRTSWRTSGPLPTFFLDSARFRGSAPGRAPPDRYRG
jgi:hypothetical protein